MATPAAFEPATYGLGNRYIAFKLSKFNLLARRPLQQVPLGSGQCGTNYRKTHASEAPAAVKGEQTTATHACQQHLSDAARLSRLAEIEVVQRWLFIEPTWRFLLVVAGTRFALLNSPDQRCDEG
jgi:hypothetical protein